MLGLDVAATATWAEWAWPCAVGHGSWVTDDVGQRDLLFELSNALCLSLGFVCRERIEDSLADCRGVGVDRGGVESTVVVYAIDRTENV